MSRTGAALRLDDVTKVYGEGAEAVTAVAGASLRVHPGEVVVVMGPSGSGKTTLLAMCGALLRPTAGRVWLGGADITELSEKHLPELRLSGVGFVFQAFNLLANLTVLENVRIVPEAARVGKAKADLQARELLDELGLGRRLHFLPDKLSAGEKQRVAIARSLANDPPLVLADEPTGSLDSRAGAQVMHLLEALARQRGKAVVCVTHDRRTQGHADRVLWLEDGRLSGQ
ncbi:MAG: ABC transporter ATP-binding protein [Actinomycetota bacterium]|nr:ABC transporter ATP-binding protein [Actinomycetota bacterium]